MRNSTASRFPLPAIFITLTLMFCFGSTATAAHDLKGNVQLGGTGRIQRLANVMVRLYEATNGILIERGRARTNGGGHFRITPAVHHTDSIFFVTADIELGVQFVTVLGPDLPRNITINELTSVAASYAMAQFYREGYISGDAFGLQIASLMNNNIVDITTGESSPVLLNSPNADQTHSLRMTRSLANLLNASASRFYFRVLFLLATKSPGGAFPTNTAVAMANLARDPGHHAVLLYYLSQFDEAYSPPLAQALDAWTVTVKVNDSGDDRFLFGGPGNVAFDSRGYAWIVNNSIQGTPNSANWEIVLKPDGTPADGGAGYPTSPIFGGGVLGGGWGVTVDRTDTVWFGNFGWGGDEHFPTTGPVRSTDPFVPGNGSVSKFSDDGTPLSNRIGFFGGTWRVQAIKVDDQGNVWTSSFGNDKAVVFLNGNPRHARELDFYDGAGPFGLAIGTNGDVWISNSGGLSGFSQSTIAKLKLDASGELVSEFVQPVGQTLKVIDVDSQGNAWVASQGNSLVYAFRPDGTCLGGYNADGTPKGFHGGGIHGPWGLCIDGEDNIWIGNFGPIELYNNFTHGGISKLCGVNPAAWPPGKSLGDPLSPPTRYTVQSAGEQVLLHDGTPLYGTGPGAEPSYAPIMRQTSLQIDRAGNIWGVNNWKPRFATDIGLFNTGELVNDVDPSDGNPGGDGIIIYVGLAPPPPSQFGH